MAVGLRALGFMGLGDLLAQSAERLSQEGQG